MRNLTIEEWITLSLKQKFKAMNKWCNIPLIFTSNCAEINAGIPSYRFTQVSMGNSVYEFGVN